MKVYRVAVIPGDGIGPEVTEVALEVLEKAAEKIGQCRLEWVRFPWGSDYYLQHGAMMPSDALKILKDFDAIYLGAIGDPRVPDHISLELLLAIRKGFDQYINLRPIKLLEGVDCPLRIEPNRVIDFVVVRENTEGEYSRLGGRFKQGTDEETAIQLAVFSRKRTREVIRYAFELARKRQAKSKEAPRPLVTNCTKSNALNFSMVMWDEVFEEVAASYPDVHTDKAMVDAITMWMVRKPDYYDVIVASNLFGDIITDLGAAIQGGMGLAAGANINPERRYPSMFEPIHGSAPKYKGQNRSNPMAAIWSGAMMLDFLGAKEEGALVMNALQGVLRERKVRTYDLGGTATTTEVGRAICEAMKRKES